MHIKLAAAAIAMSLTATAATAQTGSFGPGLATPSAGFTIINTFTNTTGLTGTNFQIKTPPADGDGAPPANSIPAGTSYLSVLGGGFATYSLASLLPTAVQFDWGSIDGYNTLSGTTMNGNSFSFIPGTASFPNAADGNQFLPGTNGRFTVSVSGGDRIKSITFASSSNSFEVDNLAVSGAVPEPATWGMMILGFGAMGYAMRRRAKVRTTVAFA